MIILRSFHSFWYNYFYKHLQVCFQFGSLLSVYGCFRHHKICNVGEDAEFYLPLTHKENTTSQQAKSHSLLTAAFWVYVFQIIFQVSFPMFACLTFMLLINFLVCWTQMTAGAVMLTDSVYWMVIVPFLTIIGYEMGFVSTQTFLKLGFVYQLSTICPFSYFVLCHMTVAEPGNLWKEAQFTN